MRLGHLGDHDVAAAVGGFESRAEPIERGAVRQGWANIVYPIEYAEFFVQNLYPQGRQRYNLEISARPAPYCAAMAAA